MRTNGSKFLMSLLWSVYFYSNSLFASTTGETMPWEGPLTAIANSLTGPVARIGAIMAMVGFGLAVAMNQSDGVSKNAIRIIFGLSIAFAATTWGLRLFGVGSGLLIP